MSISYRTTSYEATGRTQQKARTRLALVTATQELLAQGTTPTVEEAAATASVSRATAYRYFPNQRDLLVAAHPETQRASLLGLSPPSEVRDRLDEVLREMLRITVDTEPQLRAMLRLSLEGDPEISSRLLLRKGRAIGWIEEALDPLKQTVPVAELRRLVLAIRSAAGIEPLVWLTDVGGLTRDEAVEVMMMSARALLDQALARRR
jgi:AcrR family transcriptional regulator